jgi:hypothetical protein
MRLDQRIEDGSLNVGTVRNIKARFANGELGEYRVLVAEKSPWQLHYTGPDGVTHHAEDTDLYRALQLMRQHLEKEGTQLLCAGARPDVVPSGMSRSIGGGRKAYVIRMGVPANNIADLVDIFDDARSELVGSVGQQRAFVEAWLHSLKTRITPSGGPG